MSGTTRVGLVIAVVGLLTLLTGVIRFCALYIPLGISTARPEEPQMKQGGCDCATFVKEGLGESDGASPAAPGTQALMR